MENTTKRLKTYADQVDLADRFTYKFKFTESFFSAKEIKLLENESNPYDQNIRLKEIIKEKYSKSKNHTKIDFWLINKWGGIRSFIDTGKNEKKLNRLRASITQRKLTKEHYSTISSMSKVASFMDPENFCIYDSRVIYALNWLILKSENKNKLKQQYFPIPVGRNKQLSRFDMNTIINLHHSNSEKDLEHLFLSPDVAYFDYCDYIKKASKEIYGSKAKPYQLEMLLFTIATEEIIDEVKKGVKLSFS